MRVRDRYIRATILIGFQGLMAPSGANAAELLRDCGIDPRALTEPDRLISYGKLGSLLEVAAKRYQRPSLGLDWVLRSPSHFPNHGPLVMLGHFVDTMQDWVDLSLQYWRYHTDAYTMQQLTDERTGQVAFRYRLDPAVAPACQLTEMMIGAIVPIFRKVGHLEQANPTIVRFQHCAPPDLSLHERVFRCPVEFAAEHDEIVVDPSYLTAKTGGVLRLFKPVLGYYIKSRIQAMPLTDQSMAATVALGIRSAMGSGKCNAEFVATSLGLSPKKLQRLLASEKTSFSDILEQERAALARQLLASSDAPVANIAGLLDYSTTAPFTQAFKRWTGVSPMEYRKRERGKPGGFER